MPPKKTKTSDHPKRVRNGNSFATKADITLIRNDMGVLRNDMDQRFGDMREDMDQRFGDMRKEMDQRFGEVRSDMQRLHEESKRHMGVLFEEMAHRLEASLEFATELPPKIEDHEQRISRLEEDVQVIKTAVTARK